MKVKLYIVTYKRPDDLRTTLSDIFNSDIVEHDVEVYIANNHTEFYIDDEYVDKVTVLHNVFRPDHSTGHLSRNYNEIFLHGIQDLTSPDCDLLIHTHDDNTFQPNWFSQLLEYHKTYDFITFSQGCGLCSYLPRAVKSIGMWDERFCTIGYHEGDYFLRALRTLKDKVSINDPHQGREFNPLPHIVTKKSGTGQNFAHQQSFNNYSVCRNLWELKWPGLKDGGWSQEFYHNVPKPAIPTYILYPYFEKHMDNLEDKYFKGIDVDGRPFL